MNALDKGTWVGNCVGAMQQWDLGNPEYAKEMLNGWVAFRSSKGEKRRRI